MGSYCRVVVHRSWADVEPILLKTFEAESIVPAADAEPGDLFLSEGNDAVALDENDAGSLLRFLGEDPEVELLTDLSRQCDARISAIAVQTGVGFVSILVVDRGTAVRRYMECDGKIETDEGQLPG
jgi:hypothetical protein